MNMWICAWKSLPSMGFHLMNLHTGIGWAPKCWKTWIKALASVILSTRGSLGRSLPSRCVYSVGQNKYPLYNQPEESRSFLVIIYQNCLYMIYASLSFDHIFTCVLQWLQHASNVDLTSKPRYWWGSNCRGRRSQKLPGKNFPWNQQIWKCQDVNGTVIWYITDSWYTWSICKVENEG